MELSLGNLRVNISPPSSWFGWDAVRTYTWSPPGVFSLSGEEENDLMEGGGNKKTIAEDCGVRLGPGLLFCPLSEWFHGLKYKGYSGKTNGVLGDAPFSRAHSPTEIKPCNALNPRSLWFFPLQMKLKPSFTLFSVWNSVPNLGTAHFQNLFAQWLKGWLWGHC